MEKRTRRSLLPAVAIPCLSVVLAGQAWAQRRPPSQGAKPDLTIKSFLVVGGGKCEKGKPVLLFRVGVANTGLAPSPGSVGKALVRVVDDKSPSWANGAFLAVIPAPGSQTVEVPLYMPPDATLLASMKVHPFRAIADPFGLVDEANEGNNASQTMNVELPVCAGPRSGLE
jgi:hypothetical protein